jgi:hypothetical protein
MATTIVTKSGSGAPTASDLVAGELAVDLTNKRLYTENSGGTVIEVGSNPYNFTANHDGSAKLATTATGIDVTGTATMDGLTVDGDLAVSAANSRIRLFETDTTDLNTQLQNQAGDFNISRLDDDASASTLQFKIDHATGNVSIPNGDLDVTGSVTADGATIAGTLELDSNSFKHTALTPAYTLIESDVTGENTQFLQASGTLRIRTVDDSILNPVERLRIDHGTGDISFYSSDGLSQALFWDASAESLGIGTSLPRSLINASSATGAILTLESSDTTLGENDVVGQIDFYANDASTNSTGNKAFIKAYSETTGGNKVGLDFATSGSSSATGVTAMTIDSSGNVGIGGTPTAPLHVFGGGILGASSTNPIAFTGSGGTNAGIGSYNANNDFNVYSAGTGNIKFVTGAVWSSAGVLTTVGSERMRIDSSGNLLVGTTDTDPSDNSTNSTADDGVAITAVGEVRSSRYLAIANSGAVGFFNRTGTDGDIVRLRKSGTTVGSIGTKSNDLTVGTGDTGIQFYDFGNSIVPTNISTNTNIDATIDLGLSGVRFKDLYLSGGVYLGGTGAANHLDDYEEGTFTPLFTSASGTITTGTNVGRYVKVGNLVHCNFNIRSTGVSGISGAIGISGMPFTAHSPSRAAGSIWYMRSWGAALDNLRFGIAGNSSALTFYTNSANATVASLDNNDFGTGSDDNVLECSIVYRTT